MQSVINSCIFDSFIQKLEQFDNKEYQTVCFEKLLEVVKQKFCMNNINIKNKTICDLKFVLKKYGINVLLLVGEKNYKNILFNNIPNGYTILEFKSNVKNRIKLILDELYKFNQIYIDNEFYKQHHNGTLEELFRYSHIDSYYEHGIYIELFAHYHGLHNHRSYGFNHFGKAIKSILPAKYNYENKFNITEYALVKDLSLKKYIKVYKVITTDMFTFLKEHFTKKVRNNYIKLLKTYLRISNNYMSDLNILNLDKIKHYEYINIEQMLKNNLENNYYKTMIQLVYPNVNEYFKVIISPKIFFNDLKNILSQQEAACKSIRNEWIGGRECYENVCLPIYNSLKNIYNMQYKELIFLEEL